MARLRLHILGSLRVGDESGRDLELPAGKPLALLALVALDPSEITRDDAARLLWPGSSHDRARASVRQALWTLRKKIHPEVIREDRDGSLHVDREVLATDLDRLKEAMEATDPRTVVELWSGGPFKGIAISDAPGWNQWASEVHGRWESRVGSFLERHAEGLPAADRLSWVGYALGVRPYRPQLHALRVRTFLELGLLEEAETALEEAREELLDDFDDELGGLEADLRSAVRERYATANGAEAPLPFVGRIEEFAALVEALAEVRRGTSGMVAVVGPPGIGKTRLAREFAATARLGGAAVVEAGGSVTERRVEFGVVATLARQLLALPGAAGISNASAEALRTLVPSAGNLASAMTASVATSAALGDALADLLDAVAEEGPVVLLVDDLQWADEGSLALLHRATRLVPRRPVLVVETCRSEDADRAALRTVEREVETGRARLVRLSPLPPDDIAQLLIELAAFPSEADAAEAAAALYRASRGHPLHLVALLRALKDRGVLQRQGGEWVFQMNRLPVELEMPSGLQDLLARRLALISADAMAILEELARTPGGETARALRRRTDLSEARFTKALTELFGADLVGWRPGERIDFSHDLLREAVSARSSSTSRSGVPWGWTASAGLLVILAILMVVSLMSESPSPFDGTVLEVSYSDAVYRYEPGPGGGWEVTDSLVAPPIEGGGIRPRFMGAGAAGGTVGQLGWDDRGPDIIRIHRDGSWDLLLDGGGDDGIDDLSPDGSQVLLAVEDTAAPQYRLDLVVLDLETGNARIILEPGFRARARWTPSGRSIVAGDLTLGEPDVLLRLRPDGSAVERISAPEGQVLDVRPCGEAEILVQFRSPGALERWYLVEWGAGVLGPVPVPVRRARQAVCSPDGRHIAFLDPDRPDRLGTVARDAGGEAEWLTISPPPDRTGGELSWRWKDPVVPTQVHASGPDSIPWGGRGALRVAVTDRRGRPWEGDVTWSPLDPGVLNLRGDTAIGNNPGIGHVEAAVDGWLKDTVTVHVTAAAAEGLLLGATFSALPGAEWDSIGSPMARIVDRDDGPALALGGDAVWRDGIRSVRAFPVERGLTVEVLFRLPLTGRLDRQSISVCLVSVGTALETMDMGRRAADAQACVQYPQGELQAFDPTSLAIFLEGSGAVNGIPAPGLGGTEWASLGLQVRPDGRLSAIVNGEETGAFPELASLPAWERYNVVITGRAEDTELLLRRVTVWAGARY